MSKLTNLNTLHCNFQPNQQNQINSEHQIQASDIYGGAIETAMLIKGKQSMMDVFGEMHRYIKIESLQF